MLRVDDTKKFQVNPHPTAGRYGTDSTRSRMADIEIIPIPNQGTPLGITTHGVNTLRVFPQA
jgi:hypothetical protein